MFLGRTLPRPDIDLPKPSYPAPNPDAFLN